MIKVIYINMLIASISSIILFSDIINWKFFKMNLRTLGDFKKDGIKSIN